MDAKKHRGGDLMQPRHIFKVPKRGEPMVDELPRSLAGEETLAAMKEKPVIANDVIDDVAKPRKKKDKQAEPEIGDDNGDSPAE